MKRDVTTIKNVKDLESSQKNFVVKKLSFELDLRNSYDYEAVFLVMCDPSMNEL